MLHAALEILKRVVEKQRADISINRKSPQVDLQKPPADTQAHVKREVPELDSV